MIAWIFLIVILVVLWFITCWKEKRLVKLSEELKSNAPYLPILGHSINFFGDTEVLMKAFQYFGREAIQKGGITSFWMGNLLFLDVADAVDADFITRNYMEKGYALKCARAVTGNGNIFAPESTLGVALKCQDKQEHPFIKAVEEATRLVAERICCPWQYNDTVYKLYPSYYTLEKQKKVAYDFCSKVIAAKRKDLETQSSKIKNSDRKETFKSFLELLIESSGEEKGYTDLELREEILVLIIAGNDTSATGAAFATLMLSRYPEVQQKAYKELKEVLDNSGGKLSHEDVPKLKYLEAVIKETLRLYPPVPITLRYVDRDLTLPSGVKLVKGCDIVIDNFALHRNPKYWGPDAEEFRPERWFEMEMKHPAQFMAFSHGPRNCVGYQYAMISMKTAIATMLSHYRILPASSPNKDGEFEPIRLKFDIMMKDANKFTIRLENRN